MDIRKAKLLATKGGSGSSTFRATLPTNWIREMELGEDSREIQLEFTGEEIIIRNYKEMKEMDLTFMLYNDTRSMLKLDLQGKVIDKKLISHRDEVKWKWKGEMSSGTGSEDVKTYKELWEIKKTNGELFELEVVREIIDGKKEEVYQDYFTDKMVYKDWGIDELKEFGTVTIIKDE